MSEISGDETPRQTAPEDIVPFPSKLAYGAGAFVNNLLSASIGNMMIVLNLGFGMDPALVGALGGLPRIVDAMTDPLMGHISDNTRSKWGRRRPYIFVGAILVSIVFAALWQMPEGMSESFYFNWFLVGSVLFFISYTMWATPWVALGFELTPDYYERTRLMGVQFFIGQIPYLIAPWFLAFMTLSYFESQAQGASVLAYIVAGTAVTLGVIPAIFLRERPLPPSDADEGGGGVLGAVMNFFRAVVNTVTSGPFVLLSAATFLVFNGFQLIASFQSYVLIYYVMGGDQEGGSFWLGWTGTVQIMATFLVIPFVTWLGNKIGKRRAFIFSTLVATVGYGMKWWCYSTTAPWLILIPTPLIAFSLGGLFTLMPSMIADVVDYDEVHTHQRREGMYGSVYWLMVKLGVSLALIGGGVLLNATGFDVALGGEQSRGTLLWLRIFDVTVPMATSLLAMTAMYFYPLDEKRSLEIRAQLEARHAAVEAEQATET